MIETRVICDLCGATVSAQGCLMANRGTYCGSGSLTFAPFSDSRHFQFHLCGMACAARLLQQEAQKWGAPQAPSGGTA